MPAKIYSVGIVCKIVEIENKAQNMEDSHCNMSGLLVSFFIKVP
jgi:hypothetical protein